MNIYKQFFTYFGTKFLLSVAPFLEVNNQNTIPLNLPQFPALKIIKFPHYSLLPKCPFLSLRKCIKARKYLFKLIGLGGNGLYIYENKEENEGQKLGECE